MSTRRPSLDGLRGIAALVVVVHHSLLISPALADPYRAVGSPPGAGASGPGSWAWWATYTPLHLVWAGGEAVFVFFVLSGLVLALPAVSGTAAGWRSYYPQRVLRLYVPIVAATALAFVLVHLVARHAPVTSSWWLAGHVSPIGLREAAHDAEVVRGPTSLNTAFWSLQWEVVFSVLLPLFVVVGVRVRRLPLLRWLILLGLTGLGLGGRHLSLVYLPMFGCGVVMAQQLPALDRLGAAFDRLSAGVRVAVLAGVGLLLTAQWWLPAAPGVRDSLGLHRVELVVVLVGASLVVWVFGCTAAGRRAGSVPAVRWLGKRSFSLYLVHEPIVVTVAYALHGTTDAALVLAIALPLSLAAAELFARLCEMPSHRLSQAAGRALRPRVPALA